jgi:hypothetical protein
VARHSRIRSAVRDCESATCSVPCRRSSCSAQASDFILPPTSRPRKWPHPRPDDSACLQSPTSPLPRIPQFHRQPRDGAVIGQSCLHSPAKVVVERQSQPTGSSFISARTKANREKASWTDRPTSSSILCQGSSCSPQSSDPSFQYAINSPGQSSFRGHTICLPAIAHVSLPTCPQFSHQRRFVFGPAGCSTEAPTIQSDPTPFNQ